MNQTGAPSAPRQALLTADGFQNLTSMLEPLENLVNLYTEERFWQTTRARKLFSFLSVQITASICVCQAVRPVDLGCIHFPIRTTSETIIPLRRQSHKSFRFSVNSCSILTCKRPLDRKLSTSGFLQKNKKCIGATVMELWPHRP